MAYRSYFICDGGSDWATDWSQSDLVKRRPRASFTRMDQPYSGVVPANRWRGAGNVLSVVREDGEQLQDLYHILNTAPLGGPTGAITKQLMEQAEAASHRLPPLVNVYYRPPMIEFSYAYGQHAAGPGRERGGLHTIPDRLRDQPLLTIKAPLHINTPPGAASIDAELVFYVALRAEDGHAAAEVVGVAHPWRFNDDGYHAFQNEINDGLEEAGNAALAQLRPVTDLFRGFRASQLYLVPGSATPRLDNEVSVRGTARTRMTLALVP